ncbi:hypothetical protein CTI12_AA213100 [Artemisia annua]|uniref:Uncharacterized protein n=1 Tax=Artemisia annua TaxID=35608 RepID=A0A2U1NYV4_ARTAN|nr:hypothetical protein CTI12_AA213100 [Artemisia annua]
MAPTAAMLTLIGDHPNATVKSTFPQAKSAANAMKWFMKNMMPHYHHETTSLCDQTKRVTQLVSEESADHGLNKKL